MPIAAPSCSEGSADIGFLDGLMLETELPFAAVLLSTGKAEYGRAILNNHFLKRWHFKEYSF
jgi:hypothetical protein